MKRTFLPIAALALASIPSAGTSQDHPSGAMNGGGGSSESGRYQLVGSVQIGTRGLSEGGPFSLQGGVIVGTDRSLMFIDSFE
jgi:hypothetical protein